MVQLEQPIVSTLLAERLVTFGKNHHDENNYGTPSQQLSRQRGRILYTATNKIVSVGRVNSISPGDVIGLFYSTDTNCRSSSTK